MMVNAIIEKEKCFRGTILIFLCVAWSWDSAVGIATGYGLDD
jgi:hypothetical protein